MHKQKYTVGEYQVFYSLERIAYVVAQKSGNGITCDIVNTFWRGDDGGFTAAKSHADRLHADDMADQAQVRRAEASIQQQAGDI